MSTISNLIVKEEPMDEEEESCSLVMNSQLKVKTEPGEEDEVIQLRRKVEELSKRLFLLEDFIQVELSDSDERLTAFSVKRDRLIGLGFGENASNISNGIRTENSKELVDILRIAKEQRENAKPTTSESTATTPAAGSETSGAATGPPKYFKLQSHIKKYMRKCPLCPQVIRRRDLLEHLIIVHQEQPVQCNLCSSLFDSRKELRIHLRDDHQLAPRSTEYRNAYQPVGKALQPIKARFASWANPLFKKAKPPTREEYWVHRRSMREKRKDKTEENDSPGNSGESDDDLNDLEVVDIPVQPEESASEYLEGNLRGPEEAETSDAMSHSRKVPTYMTKCPLCHEVIHQKTLLEHLIIVHQNQPLLCNICSSPFNSRKALRLHLTDDHHHGRRSATHKKAYRSALKILKALKPRYESWANPLINAAAAPSLEEFLIYHRSRPNQDNAEEGDIPWNSDDGDDGLHVEDPDVVANPAHSQVNDWSASRYFKRKKQVKPKKRKGKTLPLHIRKPFQCRYCARRYFTKEPMELHQIKCSRAALQKVEVPPWNQ